MSIEQVYRLQEINARYVEAIDDGRFEEWPDFFMETCKYRITTAENVEQGLPLSIIYATSRAMLRDRVKALREANVYEAQRYRHVLGPPRIAEASASSVRARSRSTNRRSPVRVRPRRRRPRRCRTAR